jgi:dihydroflavonol-4-reductase
VRTFLTGGTGFIGQALARALVTNGDEVRALVRTPAKASVLADLRCEVVEGDVSDPDRLRAQMDGCEGVVHNAGVYRIGIPKSERAAMFGANVLGTEHVLDAAARAGASRITYVSTANVFGDTHGVVVDESYVRPPGEPFLSYYDETKYLAHQAALERIGAGMPVVVAMPTVVIGPGDHSSVGTLIRRAATGKLAARLLPALGITVVHVDDGADGIAAVHERGTLGESYVIGGQPTRLGDVVDLAARVGGRRPPRLSMPDPMLKLGIPFGPVLGKLLDQPPNLREIIDTGRATYWASDAKARRELGYAPRDVETAIRLTVEAARSG